MQDETAPSPARASTTPRSTAPASCALAPAATEREAQDFVAAVRREHADATHNCYA